MSKYTRTQLIKLFELIRKDQYPEDMDKTKIKDLNPGDRFQFKYSRGNPVLIVENLGRTLKYSDKADTRKYKVIKEYKDIRDEVYLLNKI